MGINFHKDWHKNLFIGLSIGTIVFLIGFIIVYLGDAFEITGIAPFYKIILLISWNIAGTTIIAFSEEILMRGYVFNHLSKKFSLKWTTLLSSLLFTGGHFYWWGMHWSGWVRLFLFGIAMSIAYILTKSLWLSMGLHWGWNFGNYQLGYAGTDVTSMFSIQFLNDGWTGWLFIGTTFLMIILIFIFYSNPNRSKKPIGNNSF